VPLSMPHHDPAPPRRFAPLASIEPDDNEPAASPARHSEPEPAYEEPVTPVPTRRGLAEPEHAVLDDDDLDVPAFIRRKVD
jgi:hypothetical protein